MRRDNNYIVVRSVLVVFVKLNAKTNAKYKMTNGSFVVFFHSKAFNIIQIKI